MKRWVLLAAVALLLAALVPSALAAKGVAYVNRDTLNVYNEMDKESKVVKTLKGGDKVVIFEEDGNWTGIFYINKKGDDKVGYVQSKYLSDVMPEKYCKHEWTKWEIYREATCTRTGLRIRECTVCGTGQSKEIPKLSHEYGKWIVEREATCTEKGEQYRTCKLCGNKEIKAVAKLDHQSSASGIYWRMPPVPRRASACAAAWSAAIGRFRRSKRFPMSLANGR